MAQTHVWLSRVFFESALIVVSILLALALDEWRQDREEQKLVHRSILTFEREIRQNRARVSSLSPYHTGLKEVLSRMENSGAINSVKDFRDIMEGFEPEVLLDSAWETAVATGALSDMPYEIVSGLSLTYSHQKRFTDMYISGQSDLLRAGNLTEENLASTVYAALRYMADVTVAETQLVAVYDQVLEQLDAYRKEANIEDPSSLNGSY